MLSTFVVKEVWRDEVKRKGDSLASKLVVLQYRNEVIDIREGTSRIQAGLDRILHTSGQTDHAAEVAAGAFVAKVPILRDRLAILNELVALGVPPDIEKTVKSLPEEINAVNTDFAKTLQNGPKDSVVPLIDKLYERLAGIANEIYASRIRAVEALSQKRDHYDDTYELASQYLWALFGLGLLLNLVGSLAGVELKFAEGQ